MREYLPTLKSSKKSSGEMLLESYASFRDFDNIRYVVNGDVCLASSSTLVHSFDFIDLNNNYLEAINMNKKTPFIIQTINYTK